MAPDGQVVRLPMWDTCNIWIYAPYGGQLSIVNWSLFAVGSLALRGGLADSPPMTMDLDHSRSEGGLDLHVTPGSRHRPAS